MENGIGIAEDAKLGEMNSVNSEELEPSVKESVQLSSDGSKESDEDEVFEEAMAPPTIGSGYSTMAGGGDSKLIGTLENNEGNSDVFHEAVGTPSAAERSEVAWVKTHTFDDDKPIATETIVTGERNGLMDDIAADKNDRDVDDKKDNYKEIVDSAATADETENFEGGNEELEKSNQKPEDDVSDKKRTFLEVLTTGDAKTADADNREEQVLEISESLEPDELISTETDPKKLEIGELPHELSEVHDSNKIEGDKSSETPENGSLSHGSLVGTLNHECLKIESADAPKEQTYETPSEIEGGHRSESESSGDVLHKNEENAILGYGDQQDETNVDDKKDNYKEIVDSAATAGVTENLEGGNEELEKSNQKPEDDVSDKKRTFLEVLTTGDAKTADADNREEQVLEISESLEPDELISTETDPKKLEIGELPHELSEVQDSNKIEGDNSSETPENGSLSHGSLVGTLNHECLKIESADAPKEQTYETPSEIEGGHRSESESNGDILHKNEENAILGYGDQQDECEIESVSLHPELKDVDVGEEEKSCISSANVKDEKTAELKKLDLELVQGERVDKQAVDQEENLSSSASDTSTIDHSKESCGLDTQLHSAVDDSKLVMEIAEIEPHFSLPELLVESSRSQPNIVDSSAKVSTNVIERPEQVVVEGEKKDLSLLGNKKEDVTPVAGISSSSGNSSISGLSPARPASFSDVVKMKEPVPQDTAKAKPETKPAVDISSGNTITPPAGLGHAGPLPEPASQNKDSRSRSTADTQSRNITSATPTRPAGLGRAAPLLEPASRVVQQPRVNGAFSAAQNQLIEDSTNGEAEEYDETREKLQMIRVKFLRLAHRLGQTPHNVVVAQVLYRLGLAEQLHGRSGGRVAAFSFDRASAMAEQLEAAGQEPLDFTCTIMVLGKSGVGKSATINSIFDEAMFGTDAFELGTKKVQDVVGTVQGIRVRVIDTPGLLPSWSDQRENERILHSVKKFIKKTPPDIILYLDRLDMQSRDFSDMPLLRTITEIFGPSIWFNAIVVLTHAASAPPEGPNGTATSYDMFVTQRSLVVQQAIRQAAGDMRLMNPVSLVENHSACRTNRAGQRVLPNGQVWKPHLLLLSFASKILAEANTLLKLQDTPPGRPFAPRARSPPLPFLLSSLLQSRPEVKLPSEQFGDDDDPLDDDMDDCSDSEEESEYDALPPFKSLTKAQLEKLSKVQRKAYYDELEYREKLFMKKHLKEERKRRKMMKRMEEAVKNLPAVYGDNSEEESNAAASVPVPIPDLTLPASFDSDNPTYRYRSLDSSNTWLVRAVLEPNGWDHDIGYDGINVEKLFVVKDKVPISFSGHISKDKKDANLQMEVASSVKHGKGKATSLGFDMQSVGKDYAYTLRGETRFSNHRINKATAGLSATVLGDVLTGGIKLEDKLIIGKRGQLVVSGGAIYGRGEVAYGGSLEAILKDKDHPLGRFSSTLGLSIMDWQGDVSIGCNSQTQIPIGRHTNLIGRFNISNRGSGQFSVRLNSSEQLQIVLIGLIPLVKKIMGYSQQAQYG